MDSPLKGIQLLFADGNYQGQTYEYAKQIWYYRDLASYFVIRVAAVFDLFTFSSYSATAVLFACLSFSGLWMLFRTFYQLYPEIHSWLAVSCLFIPTVFFWGSGIFKDTLTLTALGWATYCTYQLFVEKNNRWMLWNGFLLLLSFFVIFSVKKYILLCFLPAALLLLIVRNLYKVQGVARALLIPFAVTLFGGLAYLAINQVGKDDPRYNISRLAVTAQVTAYDIRYGWGARTGDGAGYTLGELDGTWQRMIELAPAAINVSLFRPYLWEVKNPLMLLSALESLGLLLITLYVIWKIRLEVFRYILIREVLFCLTFSLIFAFAVGVSTFNFGTLSRYKIPLMPYYLVALSIVWHKHKKRKSLSSES